ncbi:MAG: ABC transporter permease [Terracidiphilus sp.]
MKGRQRFSAARWWAVVLKEFTQLKRDRLTFAMIVGIPIMQMALFGFAINTVPRHLDTGIVSADESNVTRSFIEAMQNSSYFKIVKRLPSEQAGREALARGQLMFVVNIPAGFTRQLLRREHPSILIEADATDPTTTGSALAAVNGIAQSVVQRELTGPLAGLEAGAPNDRSSSLGWEAGPAPFSVDVHQLYNPDEITQYNVVPGLMGMILTLTMVMMTGLAITRERERGTMENLLAMPATPLEVMTGKLVPYIGIGLIQASIILLAARYVFFVPFFGNIGAVYLAALLFIAANLTVGITFSSLARNQLQAVQLAIFYFLPNIVLSGFMFPFKGMPGWAQVIGNVLPLTYFNRLIRGILLKGNGWADSWPSVWPLMLFTVVLIGVAVTTYRRTLD